MAAEQEAETSRRLGIIVMCLFIGICLCSAIFGTRSESRTNDTVARDPDAWVDQAVEESWRPIPGGNSKEQAKRDTRRVLEEMRKYK